MPRNCVNYKVSVFQGDVCSVRYSDNGRFASADLSFLHPASLRQVIEYAYTSEISCSENNIEELIEAASYLQADDVITECDAYLEKIVNKDNSLNSLLLEVLTIYF